MMHEGPLTWTEYVPAGLPFIPGARKNDALSPSPTCRNWPEMAGTRPAMTLGAASARESIVRAVGVSHFASWKMIPRVSRRPARMRLTPWRIVTR